MIGVVLVLLERPEAAPAALAAADRLAGFLGGARIDVLVVRLPPEATILPSEEVLTPENAARIRGREMERAAALKAIFDPWAVRVERQDVSVTWCELEGPVEEVVMDRGRRADVIVLRQPIGRDSLPAQRALNVALFETDRPVLIVPRGLAAPFGHRVAIAWRDDPHATRAVLSALHCRILPEQVFVLAGVRTGSPRPAIPEILTEHGIGAELQVLPIGPGPFGQALLDKAHKLGADLLVMGAYAHSPLREMIFGGVTRFMLDHADLPVLLRH